MEKTNQHFGLVVAFVLPGFLGLGGISLLVPSVAQWLSPIPGQATAGIGPPAYAVLAATAMGMVLSCVRWIVIDHIHHGTGVEPPRWNLAALEKRLQAFQFVVEAKYRFYQFYANTLIAVVWTYSVNRWFGTSPLLGLGTDLGVFILCAVLFVGSRDALAKYYQDSSQLLIVAEKDLEGDDMTNGYHPEGGKTSDKADTKAQTKPKSPKKEPVKEQRPIGSK